jgi:hypothetical protein
LCRRFNSAPSHHPNKTLLNKDKTHFFPLRSSLAFCLKINSLFHLWATLGVLNRFPVRRRVFPWRLAGTLRQGQAGAKFGHCGAAGGGCYIPAEDHSGRLVKARHSTSAALWQRVWRALVVSVEVFRLTSAHSAVAWISRGKSCRNRTAQLRQGAWALDQRTRAERRRRG